MRTFKVTYDGISDKLSTTLPNLNELEDDI